MCRREKASLQRGMNYRLSRTHSVILMSVRRNAPYRDRIEDAGTTLIYEGHDQPRTKSCPDPKSADQQEHLPSGKLTQNGKFYQAAQDAKCGKRPPEIVRVYEKIHEGIWSYNGVFHLVDSFIEHDDRRSVFKFRLVAVEGDDDRVSEAAHIERRRIIPTSIKLAVWKRDGGKCVICGEQDNLHFDHDLPWSKGGSSMTEDNVQLLCARHNLSKHDKIL